MILAQAQYPLKVESPCSIIAWWIMTINSLESWFTISHVQCASHTLVHSPLETYLDGQDKLSFQLGALQSLLDYPSPWTEMDNLSTYKESMTCIFGGIPNAHVMYNVDRQNWEEFDHFLLWVDRLWCFVWSNGRQFLIIKLWKWRILQTVLTSRVGILHLLILGSWSSCWNILV